jgi:O-succinylbenzoic acid--CoA ligase
MSDWLSEAAGLFKTKDYIITGDKTFSFNEINDRSISLAHFLQKYYKVNRGDITAIISDNNIDFILLLFALWKSGAVPVPINIRLNDSETNNLFTFLKPTFIFTDRDANKQLDYQGVKTISIEADHGIQVKTEIPENDDTNENVHDLDFDENTTALILFTSGTSGNPKGVQLSFKNLRASFDNSDTVLNHDTNEKWIASLPFYHIGGFSIITRALLSGTSVIIPNSLNTDDLADTIIIHRPTLLSLISTQLRRLINLGIKPNAELKCVLLGGGYIEDPLVNEAIKEGWPIAKVYGSTETSSLVTFVDCKKNKNKKLSGGKPIGNNQIFIINEMKDLLPPNITGEIAIKSDSCAKGYLNIPKEKDDKFRDGIYYTGDSGHIDEDGYLFIDSRMDDLIISGGENINPLEIETALLKYPGIQNVFVFGQEDNEWGHIVSVAIITKPGINISEAELKEFLTQKISTYKLPKKYYFMKEFPRSPLGKVQKEKLREIIKNY